MSNTETNTTVENTEVPTTEMLAAPSDLSLLSPVERKAWELASKLSADDDVDAELEQVIVTKEENAVGPLILREMFANQFGGMEKLDEFPDVGSREGNNPDIWTDTSGEKSVERSFYDVFPALTPRGRRIGFYLQGLRDYRDDKANVPSQVVNYVASSNMGKAEVRSEIARFSQQLTNIKTAIKRCFECHQHMKYITEQTKCSATVLRVKDTYGKNATGKDDISRSNKPIKIMDKENTEVFDVFSVTQIVGFTRAKIDAAVAAGGQLAHIKATVGRGKKGGNADGAATTKTGDEKKSDAVQVAEAIASGQLMPTNTDETINSINMLSNRLDDGSDEGRKALVQLQERTNKDDEACLAVGSLCMKLDGWWTKNQRRYSELVEAQANREGKREKLIEAAKGTAAAKLAS